MIQILFSRLGYVLLVMFLQIFLCNYVSLWGYATPLLGVMVLFRIPLNAGRKGTMLFAFIIGLILDAFSNTPGLTAGAMTVTAFMQFPLMNSIVPKDAAEDALPTINLLGKYKYFSYIAILMAIHHIVYFVFEAFNFFNPINLLMRFLATYIVSLLLAWSIEILHTSK